MSSGAVNGKMGKILFDQGWTVNGTITLSEDYDHFRFLEIIFCANDWSYVTPFVISTTYLEYLRTNNIATMFRYGTIIDPNSTVSGYKNIQVVGKNKLQVSDNPPIKQIFGIY